MKLICKLLSFLIKIPSITNPPHERQLNLCYFKGGSFYNNQNDVSPECTKNAFYTHENDILFLFKHFESDRTRYCT